MGTVGVRILPVHPDNAEAVMEFAGKWVKDALDKGDGLTLYDSIIPRLKKYEAAMWIIIDEDDFPIGVSLTQIAVYDSGNIVHIFIVGGDRIDEWLPLSQSMLLDYAKDQGCIGLMLTGRKGWIRKLHKYGWKETSTTMIRRF